MVGKVSSLVVWVEKLPYVDTRKADRAWLSSEDIPDVSSKTRARQVEYCNVLVGSISQWNFITLKLQYTIVSYSPQRF
jgi:hypothetical protein